MNRIDRKSEVISRGEKVLMDTYNQKDKVMLKGKGTYLTDIENNEYLDFISGIATNVLGHANNKMIQTLTDQASTLIHSSNLFWNIQSIQLAEKLTQFSGLDKVFFCNSGAEANEAAIKLARKYGRETKSDSGIEIITMNQSFHGRTMGTLSATGQLAMHKPFAPDLPGFKYIPFNDSKALKNGVDDKTCAIFIETIQGEGGVNEISDEFIQTINTLQKEKQILLIIDEVQTGMGRTGTFFSYEQLDLDPDIVTLAKGLGGGFPIGAMLAKDAIAKHFGPGDHGTTFGGNPLATATAKLVLTEIQKQSLLDNVQRQSKKLINGLHQLQEKTHLIEEIKGKGLLIGVKLTVDVAEVIDKSYENRLLIASSKGNILRLLPPLNVSTAEVTECLEILEKVLDELIKENE